MPRVSPEPVLVLGEVLAGLASGRPDVTVDELPDPRLPEESLPEGLETAGLFPLAGPELCILEELLLFLEGTAAGAGRLGLAGTTAGLFGLPAGALVPTLVSGAAGRSTAVPEVSAGRLSLPRVFTTAGVADAGLAASRLTRLVVVPSRLVPEGTLPPREPRTASTLSYSASPSLMASGRL